MSAMKNSVNDAMKIMRDRANTSQNSLDNATKRRKSIRNKQIGAVVGYVVGVAVGIAGVAYSVHTASKPEIFEDEN